jgi:hypothetical protein
VKAGNRVERIFTAFVHFHAITRAFASFFYEYKNNFMYKRIITQGLTLLCTEPDESSALTQSLNLIEFKVYTPLQPFPPLQRDTSLWHVVSPEPHTKPVVQLDILLRDLEKSIVGVVPRRHLCVLSQRHYETCCRETFTV